MQGFLLHDGEPVINQIAAPALLDLGTLSIRRCKIVLDRAAVLGVVLADSGSDNTLGIWQHSGKFGEHP